MVHFSDGSPMSDQQPYSEPEDDGPLKVYPSDLITFVREKNELASTLVVRNMDVTKQVVFKLKTTSPEKFKVKPSMGRLDPGADEGIKVTLLQGFQLGGLSKDKFLVMSCVVDGEESLNLDLAEFWKNPGGRKVYQNRLRCVQNEEIKCANVTTGSQFETWARVVDLLVDLKNTQKELTESVSRNQKIQLFGLTVIVVFVAVMFAVLNTTIDELYNKESYCPYTSKP
ncbi:hypothetical protein GWI33_001625 [Rhynchophorus ferrugineus]|uniref:MSP domain-containing protein n=1 Tax=Rhynchophorus ferrugineus TaxID=354439 RepID=A0A834IL70_RHYFE|nr:hypothetical protein GWI33_001625 [Rhynchophorus ferrugineus]